MFRKPLLFLSEREDVRDFLLKLPFADGLASRFVAGNSLNEALPAVKQLNETGFRVTLDYLGESVSDRAEAEQATDIYVESLEIIERSEADSTISLKPTQLGLDIDEDFCAENVARVVRRASELGSFVRIDMEDSDHTDSTLRVFRKVFAQHRNVGCVIQSYLHRSEEDVKQLVEIGAPVRLCEGAYDEGPEVAFQDKRDIDANFVRLMKLLLGGGAPTAIATHDDRMIEATRQHVAENGIGTDDFEFQMLYGVRRDYQASLIADGYGMRIYVPYGEQWYPYFMRRMAERPANLFFVVRAALGD
jgi:proline dehydrogenase